MQAGHRTSMAALACFGDPNASLFQTRGGGPCIWVQRAFLERPFGFNVSQERALRRHNYQSAVELRTGLPMLNIVWAQAASQEVLAAIDLNPVWQVQERSKRLIGFCFDQENIFENWTLGQVSSSH